MAGPGIKGDQLLYLQLKKEEELQGINSLAIQQRQLVFQEVYDAILDTTFTKEETNKKPCRSFRNTGQKWLPNNNYSKLTNSII